MKCYFNIFLKHKTNWESRILIMAHKPQLSFYPQPKDGLFTGNETELDFLLRGILSHDIQDIIHGFIGDDEPEYPSIQHEESETYIYYFDTLCNKLVLPVDDDEKHCFNTHFDDDFTLDEDQDGTPCDY